ncbi:uncharacterized protein LOC106092183 isoform X3 [Stomoxys calcitrans]|uniref:uncharacterized protein LOC106092183 isoform X3 n=1 Tax=Stomoxys calcitrans TaxID=35570 RepID=UPI0027E25345|nr:uncharacterized protein LOC106092183 isoform X3 [Stomoxys calcitrans]
MWNVNSKRSVSCIPICLVVICGFLLIPVEVKANYNSGVKTTVYTTDPQITRQTYTTTHRWTEPVKVEHQEHTYTNGDYSGNDNDYQRTITNPTGGSTQQWTAYGTTSNSYRNQQHAGSFGTKPDSVSQYSYHQQQPQVPQNQPQPIYERPRTSQVVGHTTTTYQSTGKLQQTDNELTEYFTGCPSGHTGQLPYAYDCRRFLNCWKGRGHIQSCSVGTVFNPETLECDRPDKVKCGAGLGGQTSTNSVTRTTNTYGQQAQQSTALKDRTGRYIDASTDSVDILCPTGSQGLEPHPSDCTKFINCANGNVHIQECGPGTAFSKTMKVCDFKQKVDCTGRGGDAAVAAEVNTRQDTQHSTSTSSSSAAGHNDLPHNADILCLGGITGLFPYPFDYTKFINCKNGNTAIQNCVQGTAFSISKGYCESLDQILKIDHVMYIVSEVSYEYSQTLITCPPGTEGIHLYPFDAEKYVKCVRSQMEVVSCSPAQVFSVTRRTCLPLSQVLKSERVRLLSELQKSNNAYRNVEEHFDANTMVYCPVGLSGSYPHPFDGSKYITCAGGRLICESCASGKAFSLSRKQCDMIEELERKDRVPQAQMSYGQEWSSGIAHMETTYGSVDGLTYLMCPPGLNGYFLHPFDCTKYIECSNGVTNIDTCANGAVYSISRKECIPRDRVEAFDRVEYLTTTQHEFSNEHVLQADRDLGISCGPGTYATYPHPQDCHKFMRCANGRIAEENCPAGQVFSIQRGLCYRENEVSQQDRSSYSRGGVVQGQSHYSSGVAIGGGGTITTSTTTTSNSGNNYQQSGGAGYSTQTTSIGCPTNASGRYPHPTDCTKFVMCSNGVGTVQSCGPGTAWNQAMEVCDFKEKVNCSPTGSVGVRKQPEITCPPGFEGLYMHPYDWHKYLSCTNGITHIMDCGPGTVFSVTRKICDLEQNVGNTDRCNNGVYSSDYDYSYSQTNNNRDSKAYGAAGSQWSYTGTTQNQPGHTHTYTQSHHTSTSTNTQHQPTYTQTHTTTNQQVGGDRWTIMNRPRPQGATYDQRTTTWQQGSSAFVPTQETSNAWSGTAINVDQQSPTHTVIFEEGSLRPDSEQHSLVTTTSTQPGNHKPNVYYDLEHTTVESQRSTQQGHTHDPNWHKNHQHSSSSSKHQHHKYHHHEHTPEFHEKHPHLPNPFETPVESYAGIDIRSGDMCPFNCGNGKCVTQHEVCDGVNNCDNRKDEEKCDHLGYEIRLTGGESSNKGRVEVKIFGKWGHVCDDKFGLKDADVVCHELGFKLGAMEVRGSSYYPPSDVNAQYLMDEVECQGNETSLRECDFKGWAVHNCGPDEVVGVVCKVQKLKCPDNYWLCSTSEECIPTTFLCDLTPDCEDKSDESPKVCNAPIEYRLEGGRSKNEGRLEIRYRDQWGTVCDDDFSLKEAQVVCNSLGYYGRAQLVKNIYGPGTGPIWLDQVSCLGNETTLDQCNHWTWGENNCQHTEDVGLRCTAGPKPAPTTRPLTLSATTGDAAWHQTQMEYEQSELDDLGKYQGLWQRSSKAVHQQKQCGHFTMNLIDEYAHPEERVINGSIAKRGRHPWQATIRTRGRGGISSHWCGAVIISKKLILTAAHCLAGYPKGSYFVRVGDHYANIAESSEIDSNIENWYIHEKFREEKHMNNDIAIILLKTPLRFNDYVQPICLPEKGAALEVNRKCMISGWGSIKSGTSTPSNILRAAEVPILADEVCSRKNVYGNAMSEGMFCAGHLDENVDACDGDSGGPLVCSDNDAETLYGIISWGQHCGYANHPGVYVRVEKYIDWIYEKINLMISQGKL